MLRLWTDSGGGIVGLSLLVVVTVVVAGLAVAKQRARSVDPMSVPQATVSVSTDPRPRAVFIGDSYTAGAGGDGTKWSSVVADHLGWHEINLGKGGTGYVTSVTGDAAPKACGLAYCPSYPEMVDDAVKAEPNVIVISGGRNDGARDVSSAAAGLFSDLKQKAPKARIIVISPFWGANPVPSSLTAATTAVKASAAKSGVDYVDVGQPLQGHSDWITADQVHPNAAGHQALGDAVAAKLGS